MTNIVFTTPILEHPAAGGPQLRIENSIKALSRIAKVHVVSRVPKATLGGNKAEAYYLGYATTLQYAPSAHPPSFCFRLCRKLIRLVCNEQYSLHFAVDKDAAYLCKVLKEAKSNILWCGFGNISYSLIKAVRTRMPHVQIVCDTDSVWSRFVLRELEVETDPTRREAILAEGTAKEAEERLSVDMCDVTTAVSEVDASYFRSIAKHPARVHVFSNVIDMDSYTEDVPSALGIDRPSLFLGGSYGHDNSPMDRAAAWVIEHVMPRVRDVITDAQLYLVGRGSERWQERVASMPWVTATGKVPSVLPYLCHAKVSLVPLMFESGTRFKILESGAIGVPIVSTTLGAEGIPVENGKHLLIADDPESFAAAIIGIIQNGTLGASLAENCKALVQEHYSISALECEGQDILGFLHESTIC